MKIRWKNRCTFSKQCAFFSTWRTPEFIDRDSVLSTFHFFHFLENCQKIIKKSSQTWDAEKTSKNDPRGHPKGPQNPGKSIEKILKIAKMAEKSSFFEGTIFQQILGCKKIGKKRPRHRLGVRILGSWAPLGGRGVQLKTTYCPYPLSNTPLGRWPGELLIKNKRSLQRRRIRPPQGPSLFGSAHVF